jgi:hypothetical protein
VSGGTLGTRRPSVDLITAASALHWFDLNAFYTEARRVFINSWSGVQRYMADRGENPVSLVADQLTHLWGDLDTARTIQWPF